MPTFYGFRAPNLENEINRQANKSSAKLAPAEATAPEGPRPVDTEPRFDLLVSRKDGHRCVEDRRTIGRKASSKLPELCKEDIVMTKTSELRYNSTRLLSEAWFGDTCALPSATRRAIHTFDISRFVVLAVPEANDNQLKMVCDWGQWMICLDYFLDQTALSYDVERATQLMRSLLSIMGAYVPVAYLRYRPGEELMPPSKMVQIHNGLWKRMCKTALPGTMTRYVVALTEYADGVLSNIKAPYTQGNLSIDEVLAVRRKIAGVAPMLPLIEYALGLSIVAETFENPMVKRLQEIGLDLVLIHRDILSYLRQEGDNNSTINIIGIYRRSGMSAQAAFDAAGELVAARDNEWASLHQELGKSDACSHDTWRYTKAIRRLVDATISWW